MQWIKRGLIFSCDQAPHSFIHSHTQIPTALVKDERIRIYYATRPDGKLSVTTFFDVALSDPSKILAIHDRPILELGIPGMFDEHGIMPNVVMNVGNDIYLYYVGWSQRVSVPYSNWAGLAISTDGGTTFRRKFRAPILDRTPDELYHTAASSILIENNLWRMWYVCGCDWIMVNGKWELTYTVKYAHSTDGVNWKRSKDSVIQQAHPQEAITRPSVVKINDIYHMWYCYRGSVDFRDGAQSYRIGYASSGDGISWTRDDTHAGIEPSREGWDSKMLAYPNVVRVGDRLLMFYNGNFFGQGGIGYAELKISG